MDPLSLQDVSAPIELRSTCIIYSVINQGFPLWLYNYSYAVLYGTSWNIDILTLKYLNINFCAISDTI